MPLHLTRREVVAAPILGSLAAALAPRHVLAVQPATPAAPGSSFPRLDAKLVQEIVGASHAREDRVRELVAINPALVNAWWDWGFGDLESPLGAASHVGNRPIAEFLIEKGARVDIFAAAMLGWTDVVRAFVSAMPGVQRTPGPHGIPLLAHARVGGDAAAETFKYLEGLGDAGITPTLAPLSDDEKNRYLGTYKYADADTFDINLNARKQLMFEKGGEGPRVLLHHLGQHEFYPSGVPTTRFKFDALGTTAASVEITIGAEIIRGTRQPS